MNKKALQFLKQWNQYAKRDIFECPDNENLISYGIGYGGWAVQTNQKALASFAMEGLSTGNKETIDIALKMLRFCFESHIDGSYHCFDGEKWGHTWISTLGIERMMHAVYPLMEYMTEEDKVLMKKVLISEADWLLEEYTILAGLYMKDGNNKPESNAWNGSFLFRVATMYPDAPNSQRYLEKADVFLFNSITVSGDSEHPAYIGSQFFDSFALNHHHYMNVGYMVITLSHIAMLHFYCMDMKIEPPKYLYHNAEGLWKLVKSLTAPDGRLIRIGGDSRIRYCYCQDYAIPVWLFAKDYFKDSDADKYLYGWLSQVEKEMKFNNDGSFLSERCYKLYEPSPIYYTRLESDRADSISMILAWNKETENQVEIQRIDNWYDEYHGSVYVQNDENIRSWTWRGDCGPVGLCFPKNDSSFAEWHNNMVGQVSGIGRVHEYKLKSHNVKLFEGGFLSVGEIEINGGIFLAEQQYGDFVATEKIAVAALPDDATMVVFQYAQTPGEMNSLIHSVKGVNLSIPNDLFNECKRNYSYDGGRILKRSLPKEQGILNVGNWINADDKLGVYKLYGDEELKLFLPNKRTGEIAESYARKGIDTGSLYCNMLYSEYINEPTSYWNKTSLIDVGFAVTCDNALQTKRRNEDIKNIKLSVESNAVRYAAILGKNGKHYLVIANFGDSEVEIKIDDIELKNCESYDIMNRLMLSVCELKLFELI